MRDKKKELIDDITNLLNSYDDKNSTVINKDMLDFMDESSLKSIIDQLLSQKEQLHDTNKEWLEGFKTFK